MWISYIYDMGPEIFLAFFAFLGIVFWFIVRGIWRIVCVLLNIILIPCSIFNNIIRVKFWGLNKREINFKIFKKSIF